MRYFEAKDTNFSFVTRPEHPAIVAGDQANIAAHWAKILEKKPNSFNGSIICCNGIIAESPTAVTLGINRSDYATYQYARDHQHKINGAYGAGDATIIYLKPSDSYVFVKRSHINVSFDEGKYSIGSGGVLSSSESPVSDADFLTYVSQHADQETAEELKVGGLGPSILLGLYLDVSDVMVNKLEFLFAAPAAWCLLKQVANNENTELIKVKRGAVTRFLADNRTLLETSTLNHLNHWAPKLDQGIFPQN